jgi:hypothetical protein
MNNPYNNPEEQKKINILTMPPSAYSVPTWLVYLLGVVGLIYILNPTAGIFELLPDNLPFIGNLDEGIAFMLLWASVLEIFEGKNYRDEDPESPPEE